MKKVYVALSADFIHPGHLNIIKKARELGELTIGLLTDEAIMTYKKIPVLRFNERQEIVKNIKGVQNVVRQETLDYSDNLRELKPDFVVHGDDWKIGPQREIREKVLRLLDTWGGQLVEPEYTEGFSARDIDKSISDIATTPSIRRARLRRLIDTNEIVRILEAHNGLSGLIAENIGIEKDGIRREFHGMWLSSLTDSTAKGKPDIELVDLTSRLNTINDILEVTTKPLIMDGDTGGISEHFGYTVKTLDRLGLSAVIIEDKKGLKKNSLLGTEANQVRCTIEEFQEKIEVGNKSKITDEFMIITRIESFILKSGLDDAVTRAREYIAAGADGIMIHSKKNTWDEIRDFCREYQKFDAVVPLVVVPSSYNTITESELKDAGANVVIYANHLLRSAYPAMKKTAETILQHERSSETDEMCMPIGEILSLIPGTR